ncbi:MAG: LysR family transcriptional regulator [Pararhodobacter sp.]|nr:LysR family transcriptional regulator [Pararhodobacter sp.]
MSLTTDEIFRALQALRLRHLRAILVLRDAGSINAAAATLLISQPALTKMLREIEAIAGEKLFKRTNRGTMPTQAGALFCHHAGRLQAVLHDTAEDMFAMKAGSQGRVVLGTLLTATTLLIPRAIAALKARMPGATVTVLEGLNERHLPGLLTGEIDLIVGRVPQRLYHDQLLQEPLFEETVGFFVGAQHPLAGKTGLRFEHLLPFPWILPPPQAALRRQIEDLFHSRGLPLPVDLVETISPLTMRHLILNTDSVAALPTQVLDLEHSAGLVHNLSLPGPDTGSRVGLILRRGGQLRSAAAIFADILREEASCLRLRAETLPADRS